MRTFLMCAGKSTRYGKPYPKSIEIIGGKNNYIRTIELFNNYGVEDILLVVSKDNTDYFNYDNKIIGSDIREIDRFRNLEPHFLEDALILYGDVAFDEVDIPLILENKNNKIKFLSKFMSDSFNGEIFAIYVPDKKLFFKAVNEIAIRFEKGLIKREIGLDVLKQLRNTNKEKIEIIPTIGITNDWDVQAKYNAVSSLFKK